MTRGNPRNYPLGTLAELAVQRRSAELTLRQQLEEELKVKLMAKQMEFEKELLTARQAGVGVSLLADTTGYSRPYMYEVLKKANAGGWFIPEEVSRYPHAELFTLTSGPESCEVAVTLPKAIEGVQNYTGYAWFDAMQGWGIMPSLKLTGNQQGALAVACRKPRGAIADALEEWGEAVWPDPKTRPTPVQAKAARNGALAGGTATAPAPEPEYGTADELFAGLDDNEEENDA